MYNNCIQPITNGEFSTNQQPNIPIYFSIRNTKMTIITTISNKAIPNSITRTQKIGSLLLTTVNCPKGQGSMAKKFDIKGKFPMRTLSSCHIIRQLWKLVEREVVDLIQLQTNYSDQDVIELQNNMEDEFTSISQPEHSGELSRMRTQEIRTNDNQFSINASPQKRLKIATDLDNPQIPLLENIKRKCKMDSSNHSPN